MHRSAVLLAIAVFLAIVGVGLLLLKAFSYPLALVLAIVFGTGGLLLRFAEKRRQAAPKQLQDG